MRHVHKKSLLSCSGCFLVTFTVWIFIIKVIWKLPTANESLKITQQSIEKEKFVEKMLLKKDISVGLNALRKVSRDFSGDRKTQRTGIILWYQPPNFQHIIDSEKSMDFSKCGFPNTCTHTTNSSFISSSDAVIFHGSVLPSVLPKRREDQFWIFYTLESPPSVYPVRNEWRKQFDWMMNYRRDSQIFLPYGKIFKEPKGNSELVDTMKKKDKDHPVAWLVSNCHASNGRNEYVKEMKKFLPVDVFGRCGTPIVASFGNTSMEAYKILSIKHKFYLSFENNHCTDYITEKLYNTYSRFVPLVPVVRGGASYSEILPPGTFINTADFKSPKDLANHLKYLNENDDAYLKILQEKMKYHVNNMVEVYRQSLCKICERIQDQTEAVRTNRTDVSSWIHDNTCVTVKNIR
ncbi:alpha-(1,3)-fucosyltransferase 6-like isoform X2 [Pecten maximus]|nr:alpha-(1,3)-fucosyltransferase 6-like isoform X2 [Pecten maximus]XP_033758774.1 alpha-(1,3)-fucosyltransferase 6-like isoform X2 [Pecten maximus]XP_033758775.1 alpha-(1,3)-fucosyltransferase 6-like isoform X2 [Pecten maximus]